MDPSTQSCVHLSTSAHVRTKEFAHPSRKKMMIMMMTAAMTDSIFSLVSVRMAIPEISVKQILTRVRRISSRVTQVWLVTTCHHLPMKPDFSVILPKWLFWRWNKMPRYRYHCYHTKCYIFLRPRSETVHLWICLKFGAVGSKDVLMTSKSSQTGMDRVNRICYQSFKRFFSHCYHLAISW